MNGVWSFEVELSAEETGAHVGFARGGNEFEGTAIFDELSVECQQARVIGAECRNQNFAECQFAGADRALSIRNAVAYLVQIMGERGKTFHEINKNIGIEINPLAAKLVSQSHDALSRVIKSAASSGD